MVAHRLVEALTDRDGADSGEPAWQIDVFAEESRPPYDRVALTSFFSGRDPEDLLLGEPELWRREGVRLHTNAPVQRIDTERREVHARGRVFGYDALVIATGSSPAVPPVPGSDLPGSFVYRTVDDVTELRGWATTRNLKRPVRGAVVGGGLLGLEAAGALTAMGVETTVVEFAPRLMPIQVDEGGGEGLRRLIEKLGVERPHLHGDLQGPRRPGRPGQPDGLRRRLEAPGRPGRVRHRRAAARRARPRGRPARRRARRRRGRRGRAGPAVPDVYAIGEVACIEGRTWGLVAPGYTMAEIVADRLLGGEATFPGADTSTKLKLLGVDVASFGDAFAESPGALEVVYADPVAGAYKKLVVSDDAQTLLGGVLVGDASAYASLRPMVGQKLGADPTAWLLPEGAAPAPASDLPDAANVCSCNNVSAGTIRCAVTEDGCTDLAGVKACTRAGTSCGSCLPLVKKLVTTELEKSGVSVSNALCEHFELSRAQLFDVVRVQELSTFSEIVERHGRGRGCDICRPVVASILASLGKGHVLDRDIARLQDTNDHVMANLQKDGTYSVVPRVPGGEITPQGLIDIGQVAADFGLYTKITGGQRIDLFGARLEQLPAIWQRLIDAGLRVRARLRQGVAHGEVVRRLAVVPLRRPGLRGPRHRPGAPLPGPALAAQAQARRLRVRPRVRRGPQQGRRRDRDRRGLERVRRRQRRLHPPPRAAVRGGPEHRGAGPDDRPVPDVLRPHRRPAPADRCLGRGLRGWPRGDRRGGHRGQPRHRCRPRRRDGRATSTAMSTSGPRRWPIPRSAPSSCPSSTRPRPPTRTWAVRSTTAATCGPP